MASSLPIPELTFLASQTTLKRCVSISRRTSLSKFSRSSRYNFALRTRIRAVNEDGGVVVEDKESELIKGGNGAVLNGNGAAAAAAAASTSGSDFGYYENGSAIEVESVNKGESNGSLVKYVNGNGVASEVVEEVQVSVSKEEGRKKRIEEIGKEDAWFKQIGVQQVEVWFPDVE